MWSSRIGVDSLLIRIFEKDDEEKFDQSWLKVSVIEPNSIDAETQIPQEFALLSAYPNPFNSTTTITYALSTSSNTSLELYNVLGQRVLTLFEGEQQVGSYDVVLFGDELVSGIYLMKLMTNNQARVQKIILIK